MCLYFLERQNSDSVDCNKMEIDLVTAQILGLNMGVCTSNNLIATVSMADVVRLACRNCCTLFVVLFCFVFSLYLFEDLLQAEGSFLHS